MNTINCRHIGLITMNLSIVEWKLDCLKKMSLKICMMQTLFRKFILRTILSSRFFMESKNKSRSRD